MWKKKRLLSIICILLFIVLGTPLQTHAEAKTRSITTLKEQRDLTVMFSFETEVVDIIFVSPSGDKLDASSPGVEMATGELWSTYRVKDAEAGRWSVEYDLKSNSKITYSIIDDQAGLWIQYFHLSEIVDGQMNVTFLTENSEEGLRYKYEIHAIDVKDSSTSIELESGNGTAGEEITVPISLEEIASGEYQLLLEVYYKSGAAEVFDSVLSDTVSYTNPNELEALEDFRVYLNLSDFYCNVDWDDFRIKFCDGYRLVATDEAGNVIYQAELEGGARDAGFIVPMATKKMLITLSYEKKGVSSRPVTKEIDLENGESLTTSVGEVTGDLQVVLDYSVEGTKDILICLNYDEDQLIEITGEGSLGISLEPGVNTLYAEVEGNNLVHYVVKREIISDTLAPEITLYEDLNGKRVKDDSIPIIGAVNGGNTVSLNGETVALDENNCFTCEYKLAAGENVIMLEAMDANGNSSVRTLTIYCENGIESIIEDDDAGNSYISLIASLAASLVIIILAIIFLKKKDKNAPKNSSHKLWKWIVADVAAVIVEVVCLIAFLRVNMICGSLEFMELAESSIQKAATYLRVQSILGPASLIGGALCGILILITVLISRKRKVSNSRSVTESGVKS